MELQNSERTAAGVKQSPMMGQWHACKQLAQSAVLLFRLGDFYEAFYEDAVLLAKELGLTLTQRQGVPMAGVPFHSSDSYIDKLVGKGYRVAVAEQMEDPKKTKGIVKREITRVVTPGSLVTSNLLVDKQNNYFASIIQVGKRYGLALLDLTTADFRVSEFDSLEDLRSECYRFQPAEFLTSQRFQEQHAALFKDLRLTYSFLVTPLDDWHFDHQITYSFLVDHLKVQSLDGFGLRGAVVAINAAGALLHYIQESLSMPIAHICSIQPYSTAQFMALDPTSQRNLELTASLQDGGRKNTLLEILDRTMTPMGGRLIAQWIKQPLLAVDAISSRQDAVEELTVSLQVLEQVRQQLDAVRDLERLIMKVQSGFAQPRDLVALRHSLQPLPGVKSTLQEAKAALLKGQESLIQPLPELVDQLTKALVDEPPLKVGEGAIFRDGYHSGVDELRLLSRDSQSWMARYQAQLRENTGIKTLKVGYTRMFGYYIEVSRGQVSKMPETFERRQTLVSAERYITRELKEYEVKVLTAEEQLGALEKELFNELRLQIARYAQPIRETAAALAVIDCLCALAHTAHLQGYTRPLVDESSLLQIIGGRHPVIENLHLGEKFVPNDTLLNDQDQRLILITGPNMAGKSTYLRQVALITIMAQIGSFVPAEQAHIGLIDKVFTRIGASDDLSRGQSTFMVEMMETANILNNATDRSLVILDEIGRGTSTYDGVSIACAVAEYLLITEGKRAKTLFATHYFELTELEPRIPGAMNYNIAVRECDDRVIFLRKIIRGSADKSYGIHVGALAGLPQPVLMRARQILSQLEEGAKRSGGLESRPSKRLPAVKVGKSSEVQLLLFEPSPKGERELVEELRLLDLDHLTPVQAHAKLAELKIKLKSSSRKKPDSLPSGNDNSRIWFCR